MEKTIKKELKEQWREYTKANPRWCKTINNHHYFRSRYASKFWLHKLEELEKFKNEKN